MNRDSLVELNSEGSWICKDTGMVYPSLISDMPDLDNGVDIDNLTIEWLKSLSDYDRGIVFSILPECGLSHEIDL